MKRIMRKMLALLIASALCMSLLSGCSGSNDSGNGSGAGSDVGSGTDTSGQAGTEKETDVSKMPVVKFMAASAGLYDNVDKVQAAMNEILAERYGIQCELHFEGFGSYTQQLNLMLTSAGEVDVFYVGGGPTTFVNNGMIYDMTDLWENNASDEFKALFPEAYLEANRVGGKLYAIPSNVNFSNEILVHANKSMVDQMGIEIDDEKIWTLDEIHDLVAKAKETFPDVYGIAPQSAGVLVNQLNWESLGDAYNIGVVPDRGASRKVISITECEEYIEFSKLMRQWYQEGLIMQDVLSTTESWSTLVPSGRAFCDFDAGAYPNGMTTDDSTYYNLTIYPNWSAANCAVRLGFGIAGNTANPEAAFTLLQATYMDPDICNLLSWGIEGENYVIDENNKASLPEGVTLENNTWTLGFVANWALPNMMGSILPFTSVDGHYDKLREYDSQAEQSGCMGVVFDSTNVADQYTACINAYNKYYAAILSGTMDTESTLAQFKAELEASGEADVIAEKQAQIDAKYGN